MRMGFRHIFIDTGGTAYREPKAAFDRMLRDPIPHPLPAMPANKFAALKLPLS